MSEQTTSTLEKFSKQIEEWVKEDNKNRSLIFLATEGLDEALGIVSGNKFRIITTLVLSMIKSDQLTDFVRSALKIKENPLITNFIAKLFSDKKEDNDHTESIIELLKEISTKLENNL